MRATYTRTEGARHLLAAYELGEDKLRRAHDRPRRAGHIGPGHFRAAISPPTDIGAPWTH
jgi:hypothetical protein